FTRELMAGVIETTEAHKQKIKKAWIKNQKQLERDRRQQRGAMERLGDMLHGRSKNMPNELAQPLNLQQEVENKFLASLTSAQIEKLAENIANLMKEKG
ncbi:MAG: hypothetical protein WCK56_12625, partial [Alcaligenaceae bacterium]